MIENEVKLIKKIYDFLSETNFEGLKKNLIEIEDNQLELPFKVNLKKIHFFKFLSNIFLGYYGYPFGLLYYKAEKHEGKKLLLKQKKLLKQDINLALQETKDENAKKLLEIFLKSL